MATEQSGSGNVFDGKPYGGHGDVYRWLRRKFEFVSNWIKEERPAWDTIASRIPETGLSIGMANHWWGGWSGGCGRASSKT